MDFSAVEHTVVFVGFLECPGFKPSFVPHESLSRALSEDLRDWEQKSLYRGTVGDYWLSFLS